MNEPLPAVEKDQHGFYRPTTEEQICALVRYANRNGLQVRVRGSGHSVAASIYTDRYGQNPRDPREINLLLDRYTGVTFDDAKKQATALAGTHLARDPFDPHKIATDENGLLLQLDRKGWSLPTLGGITHQTVAGFISTGSSGGTLSWSAHESIVAIRIVDGQGVPHDLSEASDPDLFHAAGVSMGLLGVITSVTFQCVERFDIIGQESVTTTAGCAVDLFGTRNGGLEACLRDTPYTRFLWWPQPGVDRISHWQARRMTPADYDRETAPGGKFKPKPHMDISGNKTIQWLGEIAASLYYGAIGRVRRGSLPGKLMYWTLPHVLKVFVRLDGKNGPQRFWDTWWHGMPMDNQVSDAFIPTWFSELWIPVSKSQQFMQVMRRYVDERGIDATGTFAFEIYGSKANRFWMSPAYQQDVFRMDFLWFAKNAGDPVRDFYQQYWELLRPLGFRLHWGKYLPDASTPWTPDPARPELRSWIDYLRSLYPRWDDFMAVRDRMDPDQVFVTDYWRRHLGIKPTSAATPAAP